MASLIGFAALYLWLFWLLYVLVMGLYRAHLSGRLGPVATALGSPALVVGYVADVVCNLTIATVMFAELPREALVTTRLERHLGDGVGWRCKLATWICHNLLDVFDPRGQHCTPQS